MHDGVYFGDDKIEGLSCTAGEWMHISYVQDGTGMKLYVNNVLAYSNSNNWILMNIYMNGGNHNFDLDNVKVYGFTNAGVTNAVANADKYRSSGDRATTARLDAAESALITAENIAVENSATTTADYTNDIAKISTVIEQYKKAASYERYKDDATVGAEVTALLSAVDDTTKTDAEIAEMFASVDAKLEVVTLIAEVEQYTPNQKYTNIL